MTRRIPPSRRARTAVIVAAILTAVVIAIVAPNPAGAEEEISIAPNSVARGEPGSVAPVAATDVPPELIGSACTLQVTALNGSSVHPGNVLIVATGETQAMIEGIEDSPDGAVVDERVVTLGPTITLEIQFGSDGISSLGFTAGFDCPPVVAAEQTTPPTVLGQQQLPETPAAPAIPGAPTYTG